MNRASQNLGRFIIFYAVVAVLTLMLWTCTAFGQVGVSYGVVLGPARDTMVAAWRTDREQAFCVTADTLIQADSLHPFDSLYVVGRVARAHTFKASHDSVEFECPAGRPSVHTHPGMPEMKLTDCNPSHDDWAALDKSHARYDVVQCSPTAFVFFFQYLNPLRRKP